MPDRSKPQSSSSESPLPSRRRRRPRPTTATEDWIEFSPYGLSLAPLPSRPVLVFRDAGGRYLLPVWLSPVDAGIAVTENQVSGLTTSPHNLTRKIMENLNLRAECCFFTQVKGHHQFVEIEFSGDSRLHRVESRADEAISFCLSQKAKFFARPSFVEASQVVDVQLSLLQEGEKWRPEGDKAPVYN